MSFPSHLIMDFNFKSGLVKSPYWILNLSNFKECNPNFIDEINFKTLHKSKLTTYSWIHFLQHNQPTNHNALKLQISNLFSSERLINDNFSKTKTTYTLNNSVNINFLRYERLYTKLKYSRSPAFDIVSGGAAALLAGFLGFLISEKFGFELVDSGDFYYLFMYGVFGAFLFKPLLYIINVKNSLTSVLSPRFTFKFFIKLFLLFFKNIKNRFKF